MFKKNLMTVQWGIVSIQYTPSGVPAGHQAFGPQSHQNAFSCTLHTRDVLLISLKALLL